MKWPWIKRRKYEALQMYVWAIQNQRLDGTSLTNNAIRQLDPWETFRHGPVDKDAMRGPIPPSANSIRELHRADLEARHGPRCFHCPVCKPCCACGRTR